MLGNLKHSLLESLLAAPSIALKEQQAKRAMVDDVIAASVVSQQGPKIIIYKAKPKNNNNW